MSRDKSAPQEKANTSLEILREMSTLTVISKTMKLPSRY